MTMINIQQHLRQQSHSPHYFPWSCYRFCCRCSIMHATLFSVFVFITGRKSIRKVRPRDHDRSWTLTVIRQRKMYVVWLKTCRDVCLYMMIEAVNHCVQQNSLFSLLRFPASFRHAFSLAILSPSWSVLD